MSVKNTCGDMDVGVAEKHGVICKTLINYSNLDKNQLTDILHIKTGLVTRTFEDFKKILEKYSEEAGDMDVLEYFKREYLNNEEIISHKINYTREKTHEQETENTVSTASAPKISGRKIKSEISMELYEKLLKKKKNKKYYREMTVRQREVDNDIDMLIYGCYNNEELEYSVPKNIKESKIIDFYTNTDLQFKHFLKKMATTTKTNLNNSSELTGEEEFLEKYFEEHFGIKCEQTEGSPTHKLINTVLTIMKELQKRIFETKDKDEQNILCFFKSKLYMFYHHYKK